MPEAHGPDVHVRSTFRSYRTELDPNPVQLLLLVQHAGAARFAYNWGLQWKLAARSPGVPVPTSIDLHRELNASKRRELAWLYEVSKCAPQEALRDLDRAFDNFRSGRAHLPRFKRRKKGLGSFRLTGSIHVAAGRIQLPRLGSISLKERGYRPTDRHVLSATVTHRAGRWFVCVRVRHSVRMGAPTPEHVVGVDFGIASLATLSDGTSFANPRAFYSTHRRLDCLTRRLARAAAASSRRARLEHRLALAHYRIANIRRDALHKATTAIAKRCGVVAIEDLSVAALSRGRRLSRAFHDAALGTFREMLAYKVADAGGSLVLAHPHFPSSRLCSSCGALNRMLPRSARTFVCPSCGFTLNRDLNAARNLLAVAVSSTETQNARGEITSSEVGRRLQPSALGEARTGGGRVWPPRENGRTDR